MLQHAGGQRGVAKHKAFAVAGKAEWHTQQLCIVDGLLHTRLHREAGLFGLDHGQRDVGLEEKHKVGKQHSGFVALGGLAAHHHAPGAQRVLRINLVKRVPPGLHDGRADEFVADVALGLLVFVHGRP